MAAQERGDGEAAGAGVTDADMRALYHVDATAGRGGRGGGRTKAGGGGRTKAGARASPAGAICVRDALKALNSGAWTEKKLDKDIASTLGPDPADALRDPGHRVGLRNLGATCYMNCLLQCLFMNRAFRGAIYRWRPHAEGADPILSELQRLFAHLQHSAASCFDPSALSDALALDNGVQQDVQVSAVCLHVCMALNARHHTPSPGSFTRAGLHVPSAPCSTPARLLPRVRHWHPRHFTPAPAGVQ